MSAGASIEQLLWSFYRSRGFYFLLQPVSTNIVLSPWKRAGEFTVEMLSWDVRALPGDTCCTVQLLGKTLLKEYV